MQIQISNGGFQSRAVKLGFVTPNVLECGAKRRHSHTHTHSLTHTHSRTHYHMYTPTYIDT